MTSTPVCFIRESPSGESDFVDSAEKMCTLVTGSLALPYIPPGSHS